MKRLSRTTLLVGMVTVALGAAAVAGAVRPVFTEQFPELVDEPGLTSESTAPVTVPAGGRDLFRSPSLEAVQDQGLRIDQYPWFSDAVPTPADALKGAEDLVAAVDTLPMLKDFKALSAISAVFPGEEDVGWRNVTLKVDDNHLLVISKQRVVQDMVIPLDDEQVRYGEGDAMIGSKPGQLRALLVLEGEMVIIRLQAIDPTLKSDLGIDHDDLLKIAADLIVAHD